MSHDPEVYGYHDHVKTARIATRVRRAMHRQNCSNNFHEDDCVGCNNFLDCAKQQEDFDAEAICWKCYWLGDYEDCGMRTIRGSRERGGPPLEPDEHYATCPQCGSDVEDVE